MIRSALYRLHGLLGISLGLVLALMGLTGALTALDEDIIGWLDSGPGQVMRVPVRDQPVLLELTSAAGWRRGPFSMSAAA